MDQKTATLRGLELLAAYANGSPDIESLKEHLMDTLGDSDNVQQTLMVSFSGVLNVAGRLLERLSEATGQPIPEVLHAISLEVQREK